MREISECPINGLPVVVWVFSFYSNNGNVIAMLDMLPAMFIHLLLRP